MHRLFSAGVETAAAAMVLIPIMLMMGKLWIRDWRRIFIHTVFALYIAVVYVLVGLPCVTYIQPDLTVNLVPFMGIPADWKNSILNVVMFVPLGMFLPLLSARFRQLKSIVLCSLGVTLTIELLQLLTFRATDVNDLMTNVAGAVLGYGLTMALLKRGRRGVAACGSRREVYAVFGIVFMVMFWIQPFIADLLWNFAFG